MTMIAGGDERVRNAFRSKLRDEPSRPSVISTQELDASDILEVHDLAHAIERAERIIRTPIPTAARSSSGDIFDALATGGSRPSMSPTDDCAGPAVPAPLPTPLLPPAAPVAPPSSTAKRAPIIFVPDEDDAFYQPAGRMRSFADATLEGYRPEPTLLSRIRTRRRAFSWLVTAIVAGLAILAVAAIALRPTPDSPAALAPTPAPPTAHAATAEAPTPASPPASTPTDIPVLDVKSLPAASPSPTRARSR